MKGYVYILKCSDGSYYTGSTNDLEKRLWQHKTGKGAKYTKERLPVELVYSEEFQRVEEAFYREKQIQGWSRKKKEALIAGHFDMLSDLAKNRTDLRNMVGSTGSPTENEVIELAKNEVIELAKNEVIELAKNEVIELAKNEVIEPVEMTDASTSSATMPRKHNKE